MSDRKLNIGMIGAGFIGQLAHLMNYVEVKNCRVVAIAEMRPVLRQRVMARYEIPRGYATHQELLRDPEVDAVVVVVPRPYLAPIVTDCLNAGKHVFSEKPMAGTAEQAEALVDLARKKQLHYAVGYMKRYDDGVRAAKKAYDEAVASGELGAVLFARAHCYMGNSYCNADGHIVTDEKPDYEEKGWPIAPDWLAEPLRGDFAAFSNTYGHNINLLRYLIGGDVPTVEYASFDKGMGQLCVLKFGRFKATLETGRQTNRDWVETTDIFFEHGRISVKTPPALLKNVTAAVEIYKAGAIQQVIAPQIDWTWAFRKQAAAFVDDVLAGRKSLIDGEEGLADIRLIEALWKWYAENTQ